jgi:hypothetical protein
LPEPRFTYTSPSVEDIVLTLDWARKNGLSCDRVDALILSLWLSVSTAERVMNSSWVRLVLVTGLALSVQAQTSSNPPSSNTNFPPPPPLNRPPSPPDAPLPDLGSLPSPANTTKSKVKRALDRLTPNCADVVYHSCWSSPAQDPSARLPEAEREAQRNRDAGEITGTRITEDRNGAFARPCVTNQRIPWQRSGWPSL